MLRHALLAALLASPAAAQEPQRPPSPVAPAPPPVAPAPAPPPVAPAAPPAAPEAASAASEPLPPARADEPPRPDHRLITGTIGSLRWQDHRFTIDGGGAPVVIAIDRNTMVYLDAKLGSLRDLAVGAPVRASVGGTTNLAHWVEIRRPAVARPAKGGAGEEQGGAPASAGPTSDAGAGTPGSPGTGGGGTTSPGGGRSPPTPSPIPPPAAPAPGSPPGPGPVPGGTGTGR